MAHRVVCISRVMAAGSEAIGHLVAERLGFRYADEEVLNIAAEHAGLHPALLEGAEHHKGLVARVMESLFSQPAEVKRYLDRRPRAYAGADLGTSSTPPAEDLRRLIKDAIVDIATAGRVVIVAHAASMALSRDPGVLRVHVTASSATRTQRLARARPAATEQELLAAIKESDHQRREYLSRFYDIDDESPTHYDLVINTDLLDVEQVVTTVVAAANA